MVKAKLERIIEITPAYDKRDPDPKKDYGIHGCDLKMILKGSKGAIQFVLHMNWQLPHVTKMQLHRIPSFNDVSIRSRFLPLPADLGYHSPVPRYEGHEAITEKCSYLNDKPCYYDGSTLNAEKVYEVLLCEGSEGVWKYLEGYYNETFGDRPKEAQ